MSNVLASIDERITALEQQAASRAAQLRASPQGQELAAVRGALAELRRLRLALSGPDDVELPEALREAGVRFAGVQAAG